MKGLFPNIRTLLDQSCHVRVRKIIQVRKAGVRHARMRLEPYIVVDDYTNFKSKILAFLVAVHSPFYTHTIQLCSYAGL